MQASASRMENLDVCYNELQQTVQSEQRSKQPQVVLTQAQVDGS